MAMKNIFGNLSLEATQLFIKGLLETISNRAYNDNADSIRIGTGKSRMRDDFMSYDTDTKWRQIQLGAGHVISVAGNSGGARYLNINTGILPSTETILLSRQTFHAPVKMTVFSSISQRIANQEFYFELVEVDADGNVVEDTLDNVAPTCNNARNCFGMLFDGLVATTMKYVIRAQGITELVSAAITGSTTVATGTTPNFNAASEYTMWLETEIANIIARAVNSTSAGTTVINRTDYVPNTEYRYAIRIRVKNLATAPATATDFRVHCVRIIDAVRNSVDFAMNGGSDMLSQAAPTRVLAMPAITGTATTTPANATPLTRLATAGTNAVLGKATAGNFYGGSVFNYTATVLYLKLYNKATAPVPGTDLPYQTYDCQPGKLTTIPAVGPLGERYSAGIGYAMTTNAAENDATGVAAGSLRMSLSIA